LGVDSKELTRQVVNGIFNAVPSLNALTGTTFSVHKIRSNPELIVPLFYKELTSSFAHGARLGIPRARIRQRGLLRRAGWRATLGLAVLTAASKSKGQRQQ
jgi:hypothetical protein